jgi:BirA family biotin operon repressor/biotin-[acetyl-CoA-carboxylase] ligase
MIDLAAVVHATFVAQAEHHESITSTSDRAAQWAMDGAAELPLLVVADRQTAGRGRGGNRWWTGRGAMALSLAVEAKTVGADDDRSPLVALAVGLAVVETVAPRLPSQPVGIHWPNDVLAGDRKLAGILVEVLPNRRHVIGVGLNTNNTLTDAPTELQAVACTLRDLTGKEHDQTGVLIELLARMEKQFQRLRQEPDRVAAQADAIREKGTFYFRSCSSSQAR